MGDFIFWAAYWIVRFYLKLFRGYTVYGVENVPAEGPLIVAGNHTSNFDPPVLGVALPRKTHFMAKKELFKNKAIGWFLNQLGAFSIERGRADLEAMRKAIKILRRGDVLGVFPEGTRHKPGKLGKAQAGVVMIALKAKAPILPMALTNTDGGKRPVIVRIGQPILLDQYFDRKLSREEMDEVGEIIMGEIGKLLEMDASKRK